MADPFSDGQIKMGKMGKATSQNKRGSTTPPKIKAKEMHVLLTSNPINNFA
jgi:hypothetical protein